MRPSSRTIPLRAVLVRSALAVCLASSVLAAQGGQRPAGRVPAYIDEDGRPVFTTEKPSESVGEKAEPKPEQKPAETGAVSHSAPVVEPTPPASERPKAPAGRSVLDDPLLAILSVVGTRAEWTSIQGLQAAIEMTIFATDGEPLGTEEWRWIVRPSDGDRDRFELPGRRVLRREGRLVTVLEPGVGERMPTAVERSRIALLGTILRCPWSLAEARSFEWVREEPGRSDGEIELTFRERANGLSERGAKRRADEFLLVRDAQTARPLGLRLHLRRSGDGRERNLRFAGWRRVGPVEMPTIHELLRPDGSVSLRIRMRDLDVGRIGEAGKSDSEAESNVPDWGSPAEPGSSSGRVRDDG